MSTHPTPDRPITLGERERLESITASVIAAHRKRTSETKLRRALTASAERLKNAKAQRHIFTAALTAAAARQSPKDVLSFEQAGRLLWNSKTGTVGMSRQRVGALVQSGRLAFAGVTMTASGKPRASGIQRGETERFNEAARATAAVEMHEFEVVQTDNAFKTDPTVQSTVTLAQAQVTARRGRIKAVKS